MNQRRNAGVSPACKNASIFPARKKAGETPALLYWIAALLIAITLASLPAPVHAASILDSKHNLSSSGPGDIKALSEDRVCIFCHTPHGARPEAPLWNRKDSAATYIPYNSPTIHFTPGQPTGASKLCLSCHDGTIAIGNVASMNTPIAMTGSGFVTAGHGLIGTDLSDDHPISFNYADVQQKIPDQLAAPAALDPRVRLDASRQMQCTSCHNPHDDQFGQFLVINNQNALLCRQCHLLEGFDQNPHALSTARWNGAGPNPWPNTSYTDVQSNACLNCHYSHEAGGKEELLRSAQEEQDCYVCHNGNVASYNLQADFQKPYHHPVENTQGVHKAGESPLDAKGHVECVDCHNPHLAHEATAQPPYVMGVLEGVTGISLSGAPLSVATREYEVCLKCHSDESTPLADQIARQVPADNLRLQISPDGPSFHPIAAPGLNPNVPSLIAPLTPGSMIYCSDCHNSDSAQDTVIGSRGPHGSIYEFLLASQYRTGDNISESPTAYALCYKCHSRASILGDQSFPEHQRHIVAQRTPCSVCHDPHGINEQKGTPENNAHLINFDTSVVQPDSVTGRLEYQSLPGVASGQCYLRCHGVDHSPLEYRR